MCDVSVFPLTATSYSHISFAGLLKIYDIVEWIYVLPVKYAIVSYIRTTLNDEYINHKSEIELRK